MVCLRNRILNHFLMIWIPIYYSDFCRQCTRSPSRYPPLATTIDNIYLRSDGIYYLCYHLHWLQLSPSSPISTTSALMCWIFSLCGLSHRASPSSLSNSVTRAFKRAISCSAWFCNISVRKLTYSRGQVRTIRTGCRLYF